MSRSEAINPEIEVQQVADHVADGRLLVDIRSEQERQSGHPPSSMAMSPDEVFRAIGQNEPAGLNGACFMCAVGVRSAHLVSELRQRGHHRVQSVAGGFKSWREAGFPTRYPAGLDAGQAERYARHLVLPLVGPEGQRKLLESRVLLAGIGGLNSPAALYLAAAGVGALGLVDDDAVELSNLQRQVLYEHGQVGEAKTGAAKRRIAALNPGLEVKTFRQRIRPDNAASLVDGWDLVIDGTDNMETRYALNRACVGLGIPLVYGAVMRFQGQVSVFWPAAPEGMGPFPCLECFIPRDSAGSQAPSCSVAGVLGVLPGLIGTLQATEALKLLLGLGDSLAGRLLMVDALGMDFRKTRMPVKPDCPVCSAQGPGS